MFRRTFWFTTGVAAGVWATTKVNSALNKLTPESLAAQAADRAALAGRRVRVFALDVREGMADREAALKDALGLGAPPGRRVVRQAGLDAPPASAALEAPPAPYARQETAGSARRTQHDPYPRHSPQNDQQNNHQNNHQDNHRKEDH